MHSLSHDQRYAILRQAISAFLSVGYRVMWNSHNAACLLRPTGDDQIRDRGQIWGDDLLCFTVDRFGNVERE